jgi:hypothetical protein
MPSSRQAPRSAAHDPLRKSGVQNCCAAAIFSIEFLNEKEPGAAATKLSQAGFGNLSTATAYKPGNALPSPISLHNEG